MAALPPLPSTLPIGRRLRMRRDEIGLTAQEVAALAGLSPSQLSRLEHGRHRPTWETVERICAVLGLSIVLREEVIAGGHNQAA